MRTIAFHCGDEPLSAGHVVLWLEHIDPATGPLDDVCQAEPPIRKTPIVLVREWPRHKL